MTLERQLRDLIDETAPAVTLDEIVRPGTDVVVSSQQPRRNVTDWLPRLSLGAVALGCLALFGFALAPSSDDENVVTLSDAEIPAEDVVFDSWALIEDHEGTFTPRDVVESAPTSGGTRTGSSELTVNAIAATADGYIAVGREQVGFLATAAVWASPDGRSWERVNAAAFGDLEGERANFGPTGFTMSDVAVNGPLVVAVGYESRDAVVPIVWTLATDGSWRQSRLRYSSVHPVSGVTVVAVGGGFVALASEDADGVDGSDNQTVAWVSSNGFDWNRVDTPGFGPGESVRDVAVVGDRLVAVGSVGGFGSPQAGAWISDDGGRRWQRASVSSSPDDRPATQMVELAIGPGGLVAVGTQADGGPPSWSGQEGEPRTLGSQQDILLWTSPDGEEWVQAGEQRAPGQIAVDPSITVGPAGFLVTYTAITERAMLVQSFLSADGVTLTPSDLPLDRAPSATLATGDRYVSITSLLKDSPPDPGAPADPLEVWELRPSQAPSTEAPSAGATGESCEINLRIYNSARVSGIAGTATNEVIASLPASSGVTVRSPEIGPPWSGDVALLIGPDALCFDPDEFDLPPASVITRGDLTSQWIELVGREAELPTLDGSNTVVVVLGERYSG